MNSGDLNNKHLNSKLSLVRYSDVQYLNGSLVFKWKSNNGPLSNWKTFDHLNTRLVLYLDPHCTVYTVFCLKFCKRQSLFTIHNSIIKNSIMSKYQTSSVFKWLIRGRTPSGPEFEVHLNNGLPDHLIPHKCRAP